jgi:hypothetical protein
MPRTRTPGPAAGTAPAEPAPHFAPPYLGAALAGVAVFALYAITLAPTTAFWDASEYIATTHILGIPHPPGNPLFVVFSRAWELLLAPTGLSTAVKVNLFSAVMGAGAAAFWFLVVHRILAYFSESETFRRGGAAVAVVLAATPFTVWNHANVNEKVYTVSLFTIALLTWFTFLWRDHVEEHRGTAERRWHDDNLLVFMAFVLALSVGNHLMAFLAAPAMAVVLYLVKPRVFLNWKLYASVAVFAVIGLSIHLYLPIRAGLGPIINEAAPTCDTITSALVSIVTFGNAGCENLSAALAREQYAKPPVLDRLAPFWAQMANYFQYFDWQWSRSLQGNVGYLAPARLPFTLLFLALGAFGAWEHWRRDRVSAAYMGVLFATLSVGLVFYLNFRYGWEQAQVLGLPFEREVSEVRERDYFFIVSFAVWGLWAGIGLAALWQRLATRFAGRPRPYLMTSPVLAIALLPLVLNWSYASRAGDYAARDWAFNLLQSVEPYAVLFTNGDNDTFPLWYLQEVEGIRRDVTVIVHSYLNTVWYAGQVRDLTRPCPEPDAWAEDRTRIICQRPWRPDGGPEEYARLAADRPTREIIPLDDSQLAAMRTVLVPEGTRFEARGMSIDLQAGMHLLPADQLILTIIHHAWGDRPIYFATTTANHRRLGMGDDVVRQGVALKLTTPEERQGMQPMSPQGRAAFGAYLDVERTRTLLEDIFVFRDLADRPQWVDSPTRGIPTYYATAYFALAQAMEMQGEAEVASRYMVEVERWIDLSER